MSITTLHYKPKTWSPAYNPIIWSFLSNNIEQIDFSYVVDLYVNGATGYSYRVKQRPNPSGVCMIDTSTIMQSYIELTDYAAEYDYPYAFRNSSEIMANVYLKVGEEYTGSDGSLTIFNGSGATGEPAYELYSIATGKIPVRVTPSALDYYVGVSHLSSTADDGFYNDYIMDGDGKFLKRDSNSINVKSYDHHTLAFLNQWDGAAGTYQSSIQGIMLTFYDSAGAEISTSFINNLVSTGGGPQTNSNYTSTTESIGTDMLTFRCGPTDLTLAANTVSYTVQAFMKETATVSTDPGIVASELVTFTIVDDECEDIYDNVRLSWLNDLGGRDYYNFTKFYEKKTNGSQDIYSQSAMNWSGTTPVVGDGVANQTNNWLRGGDKIYNKTVATQINIETDWLDQTSVDFLSAIPESSSVWAYIGEDSIPYTVTVNDLEYSYKNVKQQKLVRVTIEATFTKVNIKQNI